MKYVEIKRSLNELLKGEYPNIKIYGNEVKEGYETPSFFTSLVSVPETPANKNFINGGFSYKIVYFQDCKDEYDQLQKIDEIYQLFGMSVKIGNRTLLVKEKTWDYVGEKSDILEITIKCEYMENRYKPDEEDMAEELILKVNKQEE